VGWLGEMWQDINNVWIGKGEEFDFGFLDASSTPPGLPPAPIPPDGAYVTVTLASLRLVRIREGLQKFCPVVHSQLVVSHRSGKDAEFQTVTTPSALQELDAAHLDRVIQTNVKLLGPVPYRDGDIRAEIGLFSLKTADLLQPYLALLGTISAAAGVTLVGRALTFAPLLSQGIQLLTGGSAKQLLEIGLKGGIPARTGWFLIARAPRAEIDRSSLLVDPQDFRLTQEGRPPPWPYMLLRIESADRMGAWTDIPELLAAFEAIGVAVRGRKPADVQEAVSIFRATATFCPDLLLKHVKELIRQVDEQVDLAMGGRGANLQATAFAQGGQLDPAAIDPFR
jgi:hypothetical protein